MSLLRVIWLLLTCLPTFCGAAPQTRLDVWHDVSRNRDVPVKIYLPQETAEPAPVVLLSPGIGGSREAYKYLCEAWVAHGYGVLAVEHVGSNESAFRPGDKSSLQEVLGPVEFKNRASDIHFVLDTLAAINREPDNELAGKFDLTRVAMAGHSYGAQTTMAVMGEKLPPEVGLQSDARIKCAVAMSPAPPLLSEVPQNPFADIKVPVLHMTGTHDESPIGNLTAADRRIPFDQIRSPQQLLVIFKNADHMVFSGRKESNLQIEKLDAELRPMIEEVSTHFLDAHLRQNAKAEEWLRTKLSAALGPLGTVEYK